MPIADATTFFSTEIWLTPLILLPGVALLIGSTSSRFEQVHSEFHRLLEHPDAHAKIVSRNLRRRARLFRDALVSLYSSVVFLSLGSLVGAFINLWWPNMLWFVGGLTLLGIGCLAFASVQLVRESLLCLNVIKEHSQSIENEKGGP